MMIAGRSILVVIGATIVVVVGAVVGNMKDLMDVALVGNRKSPVPAVAVVVAPVPDLVSVLVPALVSVVVVVVVLAGVLETDADKNGE